MSIEDICHEVDDVVRVKASAEDGRHVMYRMGVCKHCSSLVLVSDVKGACPGRTINAVMDVLTKAAKS